MATESAGGRKSVAVSGPRFGYSVVARLRGCAGLLSQALYLRSPGLHEAARQIVSLVGVVGLAAVVIESTAHHKATP
jgi:hypothetical protein